MKTYFKSFSNENEAYQFMRMKNTACKKAGNLKDVYVIVDGPENDFVVMDIDSAIEGDFMYQFSY